MDKKTQEIKVGSRVQVINQTTSGLDFIEGYAIVKRIDWRDGGKDYIYCSVLFDGDEYPVYRWIRTELL
jgi:hypothetical protein